MQREVIGTPRLRAPEDGIVSSHRPRGWLGRRWLALVEELGADYADRVARGRSLARGGRVRDLWFAPGLANAEVVDNQPHHVTIRVKVFEEGTWRRAIALLARDLRQVAALVEGELETSLEERLRAAGLGLVPAVAELEVDCNCGDYALPCAHVAAVHHVLADALDGEPFLLLTLRGRPREQVLAALRRNWGDAEPLRSAVEAPEEKPPAADWFGSPRELPPMSFGFHGGGGGALGLQELGPAPGDGELERALRPLYEAGSAAAVEAALREAPSGEGERRRSRRRARAGQEDVDRKAGGVVDQHVEKENQAMATNDVESPTAAEAVVDGNGPGEASGGEASGGGTASGQTLTERLVDHLAHVENAKSKELANALGVSMLDVRHELLELEKMGIVYRTGQTRGTRWWLG